MIDQYFINPQVNLSVNFLNFLADDWKSGGASIKVVGR